MGARRNGMAEMYLKCPSCGEGNPEGQKFCGNCGVMIPPPAPPPVQPMQPRYTQPTPNWIHSNWKGLLSVVVVVLVLLSVVGLVYSQPWSKIKVIVSSAYESLSVGVNIYIDGKLKGAIDIVGATTIIGVWPVRTGSHVVALDHGIWDAWRTSDGRLHYYTDSYEPPDGKMDYAYEYSVGPLYTKNVFIDIPLPP